MEKVNSIDLSIIILSYKSKDHLAVLLPSIFESQTKYIYEAIVVDNGSDDGTAEWLEDVAKNRDREGSPPIKFIKNTNTGFSAGNNIGIKQSLGRYILLLNPDTKLEPDTLETMLNFMEGRPDIGISGCKIIKADGSLDLACRRRFPNPWSSFKRLFLLNNKDYNYADIDSNVEMEVDSVVGAFMLIRRFGESEKSENRNSDFRLRGGNYLDEDFFMYGEDLDLCWRCKEAGFKVWYFPRTFITHYKGSSSAKIPFQALKWFHQAMWVFYKKHYAGQYPFIFNWLVFVMIYSRLACLVIINLFKSRPIVSK